MTTIDTKVEDYFATGDSVRRIHSDFPGAATRGMISGRTYTVRDNTIRHDGVISVQGVPGMWSATGFELVSRATGHQPAPEPEPEPEWKPGTVAVVETEGAWPGGPRRAVRRGGVWHSLDMEGYAIDANVTSVRPLVVIDPAAFTRGYVAEAIYSSAGGVGRLFNAGHTYAIDPFTAADRVLTKLAEVAR